MMWFVHFHPEGIQTPDYSGSEFAVIWRCFGGGSGGAGVVII